MEKVEILKRGYLYDKKVGILPKSVVSMHCSYTVSSCEFFLFLGGWVN